MAAPATSLGRYAGMGARTLAAVRRMGAPITFSFQQGDGTYLADIDFESYVGPVTVSGHAVRDDTTARLGGAPMAQAGATEEVSEAPTLFFAPTTPGQVPVIGMLCPWAGHTYRVTSVDPVAPAGVAIAARVGVTR